MKRRSLHRALSIILSICMVVTNLQMMVIPALAEEIPVTPYDSTKYNKMWGLAVDRPIAYASTESGTTPRHTILSTDILSGGIKGETGVTPDYNYLAFSIAYNQPVSIKVYKYGDGSAGQLNLGEEYRQTAAMDADTSYPASCHKIPDKNDYIGYMYGFQYTKNALPNGDGTYSLDPQYTNMTITNAMLRLAISESSFGKMENKDVFGYIGMNNPKATAREYFAAMGLPQGFSGLKYPFDILPEPTPEEVAPPEATPPFGEQLIGCNCPREQLVRGSNTPREQFVRGSNTSREQLVQ